MNYLSSDQKLGIYVILFILMFLGFGIYSCLTPQPNVVFIEKPPEKKRFGLEFKVFPKFIRE